MKYYGIHNKSGKFTPGKDKVYYAQTVYGEEEIEAVVACLKRGWLGMGPIVEEFEKKTSKLFGKKYGIVVNSGSSANLLALKILNLPPGSEVITPACTFSTTYSTIYINNLVPVVGDSELGTYNLDLNNLPKMISPKTKAILIPHAFGNLNDMVKLRAFCNKHKLYLIDDSCDTMAGTFNGKPAGTYSDVTTSSFYASHHITAGGGGGIVAVSDKKLYESAYSYREWGRAALNDDESLEKRFTTKITGIHYDRKFTYTHMGFNLKPVEMMFAFGLEQLKRLPNVIKIRKHNFDSLKRFFKEYEKYFILPEEHSNAKSSWLAFPLTIRDGAPFDRFTIVKYLESQNIQTRLFFAGNILRHPAYKNLPRRVVGELKNADKIMKDTFAVGAHQGLTPEMLDYMKKIFTDFLKKY
ncbi:MAG: aminotransferase class I/II-fold pyridoxal phosphate-dependent enzyme [Candidatus Taylorbacteria bacterium]|nr:aminotransferase class I/II-fold pyridoxal phosphate-dependent enzyme [Candidatus Taylorbacteria bacterium]